MLSEYILEKKKIPVNSASGVVYRGTRKSDGLAVAVKFNLNTARNEIVRFERENLILRNLFPHTGIVEALSQIENDIHDGTSKDYYVMEQTESSLEEWYYTADYKIFSKKILAFKQICNALKHAHDNGYVHRDLHFRNVLMNTRPSEQMKLIDFGRAYDFNNPIHLSSDSPIWGYGVMPPEVRFGAIEDVQLDHYVKGDIYALGILWKFLFYSGYAPLHDLSLVTNDINVYIAKFMNGTNPNTYYTTIDINVRKANYQDWLSQEAYKHANIYEIPLVDVNLGIKLSDIARTLLDFDVTKRCSTIDDVLNIVERL